MNPILRSSLTSKALKPSTLPICRQRSLFPQPWRFYSQSSYGGGEQKPEGKAEAKTSKPTRDMEHPGPPPPDVSKGKGSSSPSPSSSSSGGGPSYQNQPPSDEETRRNNDGAEVYPHATNRPSNNARPTISNGQSPNVDEEGNPRPDVPEDVRRHNDEIENRHDRAYNKLEDNGKVEKVSWKTGK
ncbi:hypothetical protein IFM58399_07698 [Aspergillus lentulus]|uniref:Uncharacterized protein n=1 Tax=Aspergillus lentulus TaxID=293939 RepID=A0ABQ1AWC5_ASPLE|nr:uncharacterized protein IFM58399_07698 [Aspergillus lentulus]KAF4158232.1 hypothetical protein CNMCM6069_004432 [Aspergillus lentulus]KAF4158838.1 hypothetical protein CNMCM6936_004750 [Aspergillus lentulus]KAF4174320.1 hypothetical protein CNMCM8060_008809 [Aspergillus lentulus]KAF4182837.1 hypothetical protein CNMCM7927_009463 [Aspergillus lentulus]KAF4192711.1 hypothetical protein CNMCM8694_000045 [Aspergillus lentulus]